MEKLESYVTNFDYEYQLFNIPLSNKKRAFLRSSFELLFFLSSTKGSLVSSQQYSSEILRNIEKYTAKEIHLLPYGNIEENSTQNWWGELKNLPLEQKLNSKFFALDLLHQLTNQTFGQVIDVDFDLQDFFKNEGSKDWVIKDPHKFSGKGIQFIDSNMSNVKEKKILMPWYERVLDLGTLITNESILNYLTFSDRTAQFKGVMLFKDDLFIRFIKKIFDDTQIDLLNQYNNLIKNNIKSETVDQIQYDSFFFKNGHTIDYLPLLEFNYRKTMGTVLHDFHQQHSEKILISKVVKKRESIDLENYNHFYYKLGPTQIEILIILLDSLEEAMRLKNSLFNFKK